ncbi:hypothetical protein C6495_11950 [Candidatus Poribacteria bacterium]|nr:MAG: hypothetical protein C6495_11950 [Candidatus Poribacteria bacterium]
MIKSTRLETAPTGFALSYARVWPTRAYEKRGWKPRLPDSFSCMRACGKRAPMKSAVGNRAYRYRASYACAVVNCAYRIRA